MEISRRRNYFIDKRFQSKFTLNFCSIVLASSFAIGALLFVLLNNFTTVAIENAHVTVKRTSDFILPVVVSILAIVTFVSALAVVVLTVLASHKIAGPLYRLRKDVDMFREGNLNIGFKTRQTDQMKELADALNAMGSMMCLKHKKVKDACADLKKSLEDPHTDKSALFAKFRALEEAVNYFKV